MARASNRSEHLMRDLPLLGKAAFGGGDGNGDSSIRAGDISDSGGQAGFKVNKNSNSNHGNRITGFQGGVN